MVLSNATPGQDEEYNRWYDRIHAPTVIDGGDFVWAQRFELSPDQFAGNGTPALKTRQYMVIFAVESNDVKATLAEVNQRLALPRNVASKALDYGSLQAVSWKALGRRPRGRMPRVCSRKRLPRAGYRNRAIRHLLAANVVSRELARGRGDSHPAQAALRHPRHLRLPSMGRPESSQLRGLRTVVTADWTGSHGGSHLQSAVQ